MNFGTEDRLRAVLEQIEASGQSLRQSEECLKRACKEEGVFGLQERLSDMLVQIAKLQKIHEDIEQNLNKTLDMLRTPVIYGPPPGFRE